jgi:glycosyltransferase involved in cell wall biosynthesis
MDAKPHPTPVVYLCGPIAETGRAAKGGFQVCNRRTIDELRGRGIEVHALPYAQPETGRLHKAVEYAVSFIRLAIQVLRCERSSILHMTGLYGPFIQAEIILIYLARLRGCRTIYDVRAGSAELHYRMRSDMYRRCFAHALRSVDLVMVEGPRLAPFVESLTGRSPVFFPNHIDTSVILDRSDGAGSGLRPVIGYAGSLKPEKGIRTILEACKVLSDEGFDVDVRLAGLGPATFVEELRGDYPELPVTWLGALPSDRVLDLFRTSHFFMFPTTHRGEGQSNALTEAMACGCVPIVSDHGFNASVVGDCGVVLAPGSDAAVYAKALRAIWECGEWQALSQKSRDHIRDCFSSVEVIDDLLVHYNSLERRQ